MGQYGWVRAVNGKSRLVLELPSLGCFVRVEVGGEEIKVASNVIHLKN